MPFFYSGGLNTGRSNKCKNLIYLYTSPTDSKKDVVKYSDFAPLAKGEQFNLTTTICTQREKAS